MGSMNGGRVLHLVLERKARHSRGLRPLPGHPTLRRCARVRHFAPLLDSAEDGKDGAAEARGEHRLADRQCRVAGRAGTRQRTPIKVRKRGGRM